ncbi:MAG: hypothetical protein ACE5J6_00365 [Candidatus Bathyarchaeia archaeon]
MNKKTDFDATKLIEELGDEALRELQRRLKSKKKRKWIGQGIEVMDLSFALQVESVEML